MRTPWQLSAREARRPLLKGIEHGLDDVVARAADQAVFGPDHVAVAAGRLEAPQVGQGARVGARKGRDPRARFDVGR